MAQITKGGLVKGPDKPICRDCAIYFSTAVIVFVSSYLRQLRQAQWWNCLSINDSMIMAKLKEPWMSKAAKGSQCDDHFVMGDSE